MKGARRLTSARKFFVMVIACQLWAFATAANAQGTQGQNAVYSGSSACCVGSLAFIDASVFATSPPPPNRNFCGVLSFVLQNVDQPPTYPSGAVIDARGLNSGNTSMTCNAANPSPWAGIANPPPSTILLPATGGTTPNPIIIPSPWTLPNNTTLIGQGDNISSGTTIQANFATGDMIDLGATLCPLIGGIAICNSVAVENLILDGNKQAVNGIVNTNAQTGSHVDHVTLYQIRGTGLSVSGMASDSGPYSNITFDLGTASGTSSTHCASINGLSGTLGIHGLTCIAENNDPPAAILLDSSNNSIEDVTIMGFYDGILIGANAQDPAARSGSAPSIRVRIAGPRT